MIRILLHGAGRMALRVLANQPGFKNTELVGLVSRTKPADVPAQQWWSSLELVQQNVDLLIDFTLPGGTATAAQWCATHSVAMLSGTTGLGDTDFDALKNAAHKAPVLWAANLSQGVALTAALLRQCATVLGDQADVSIHDVHHVHKLDAPSGTALALGEAVLKGRSQFDAATGQNQVPGDEISYSSTREGEVIGDHTVRFALGDEVLEIRHQALHRDVFAKGALRAGQWLVTQKPGMYTTSDWLALG